ncbi:MAG TPA: serine/threonine protein kinase [Nanoarchaeota archaeon]|nr:serine/threonine protein kinase [Candidatus Woesearchaeota archaeon]HIH15462.1 serine/threonine protein kinase [Nanoarchaeota archaeon]HIH59265.1 serine/threonine protein kinase [Nanoarchaeota archaeon]HII13940.1 serine/threonine protein kinase [Nanoarchaeota archaeon]HIJ04698.1 serine/threonine protein kinase [Nanoarchaeota archaeon]
MELFAKGKRSLVYKEGNVIIKEERKDIQAVNRIENEAHWLQIVNKYKIGPRYIKHKDNKLYLEYIKGPNLEIFLKTASKEKKIKIFKQLLEQAYVLDTIKVNKLEMHRVTKNAIVKKNKLILLDFERCKKFPFPKNVTQAVQFINRYLPNKELLQKAKNYKEAYSEKSFKELKKCLTNTL